MDIKQLMMATRRKPDRGLERYDAFFAAHYDELRRYAYRLGADDPDDVVSESMAALWRSLSDVRGGAERAWCFSAVRRITANQRRAAGRREALHDRIGAEPVHHVAPVSDDPVLTAALLELSVVDREILLLSAWSELGCAEIATVIGASRGAVAVRLHRARSRFRTAFRQATAPRAAATRSAKETLDAC